jgi:hypothetical protein
MLRTYTDIADRQRAQESVDFPIEYLPDSVIAGGTEYSLGLVSTAVAPCQELGIIPHASARLSYLVRSTPSVGSFQLGQLTVFYARQQVAPVDNSAGTLKAVTIGEHKGVFWESESYRDYSGALWLGQGPISVMVLEHGDLVTTFVGQKDKGITEEMLTALVRKMHGLATPSGTPQALTTSTPLSNIIVPRDHTRTRR